MPADLAIPALVFVLICLAAIWLEGRWIKHDRRANYIDRDAPSIREFERRPHP